MNNALLYQIESYVTGVLGAAHKKTWPFHNIDHVKLVVDKCRELAAACKLDEQTTEELTIAAWFHDIGYATGSRNHELKVSKICMEFLNIYNYNADAVYRIIAIILSTKYTNLPITLQEKIIADADLYHLSSEDYPRWADKLFREVNQHTEKAVALQTWIQTNIRFLQEHVYHTEYALKHWEPQKLKNLEVLKQKARSW